MPLESPQFISDLIETNPALTDDRSQGALHLQNLKRAIKQTFPNIDGAVTLTQDDINDLPTTTAAYTDAEIAAEIVRADADYAQKNGDLTEPFSSSVLTSAGEGTFFDGGPGEVTITDILNEITALKTALYPVGSIYYNGTDATSPATLLGFGSWSRYGAGRVAVHYNAGDSAFNAGGKTGGAKTVALTEAQMPRHRHQSPMKQGQTWTGGDSDGSHKTFWYLDPPNSYGKPQSTAYVNYTGSGSAHNNLQPYITVHAWIRTA